MTFDTFISGNLTLKLITVHPFSIEVHCRTQRADISCVFSWFTSKTPLRWHAGAETTYTNQRRDSVKARAVCAAAVSANQNWRHYGKGRHTNVSIKLHFNKILQSWLLNVTVRIQSRDVHEMLCVSIYLFIECSVSKNLSWFILPPSQKSYEGEKIRKCVQLTFQPIIFGFMVNGKWSLSDGKPRNSAWHGKRVTRTTRKNIRPLRIKFSLCLVYRHHYVLKHSRILIEIKCVENSMFFKAAFTKRFVSKAKA